MAAAKRQQFVILIAHKTPRGTHTHTHTLKQRPSHRHNSWLAASAFADLKTVLTICTYSALIFHTCSTLSHTHTHIGVWHNEHSSNASYQQSSSGFCVIKQMGRATSWIDFKSQYQLESGTHTHTHT